MAFKLLAATSANVLFPSIDVVHRPFDHTFIRIEHVARCEPQGLIRWNPVNGTWRVESGVEFGGVSLGVGHISDHAINGRDARNFSFDYLVGEYKIDL